VTDTNPDNTPPPVDVRTMDSKTFAREREKFLRDAQKRRLGEDRERAAARTYRQFDSRFPKTGE